VTCDREPSNAPELLRARRWEVLLAGFMAGFKASAHRYRPSNIILSRAYERVYKRAHLGYLLCSILINAGSSPLGQLARGATYRHVDCQTDLACRAMPWAFTANRK